MPPFVLGESWTTAILLVTIGYSAGSISFDHWKQMVQDILLPLYACGVLGYIILRIYHVAVEPRLRPSYDIKQPPAAAAAAAAASSILDESKARLAPMPVDLTGTFKLVENNNFEELLAAQGVPWALRSAANRARPTHKITHQGNLLTIKIEGIIETQTTYQIGGPPTENPVRGRLFRDHVTYLEDKTGIQTLKHAVNDGYTVRVCRRLAPDRSGLTMTSTVKFDDESKENVECKQIFQRIEG